MGKHVKQGIDILNEILDEEETEEVSAYTFV